MTETQVNNLWTNEDLELFPNTEGINYEIIAGELLVSRSPHRFHQQIIVKIATQLELWSQKSGLGETIISPGIIFSDTDSVIPDLIWVSKERLAVIEDEQGHLTAAPELVIEVLSPGKENERRDRRLKLKLYSVQGVQEYWLVDRFGKQVEVYRRQQGKLILAGTFFTPDQLSSPLLPEFISQVQDFFP